ncbi:lipopolysaccharide kinase InaA family protein [Oceanicoccus sagamiensis]|uniref:Protein kinase domain-containing protein n=1 Tax=Oceanicoccus sagamiensis TaxID=716816 RepID=A0A1X9NK90_9GAMM|nr:lipopolysaccharide kinase InaA family protein [Oceanicoccus sagamiensis]ARN76235.1 hypothetical protein BST96_20280 [Oceanicoccus sagamiensis]
MFQVDKEAGLNDVVSYNNYLCMLDGARIIKNEKNRKIVQAFLPNSKEVFCKLYYQSGLFPLLRRLLVGSRAAHQHNQNLKFYKTGFATPKSLGYICRRVGFLKWEYFQACEYISGSMTLSKALSGDSRLTNQGRSALLADLSNLVARFHGNNWVHGDLKLNNILLSDGELYFVDLDRFGFSYKRMVPERDLGRLLVGLSETGLNSQEISEFYRQYCEAYGVAGHEYIKKVAPWIDRFQKKHKEKYNIHPSKVLNCCACKKGIGSHDKNGLNILLLRRRDAKYTFKLLENVAGEINIDRYYLSRSQQKCLDGYLQNFNLKEYDRIVIDLKWSLIRFQTKALKNINGLVIYEHDACQNFMPSSRYYKKFQRFYRKLPRARIICSGWRSTERLQKMGFSVDFVPKYYDDISLSNMGVNRDIGYAFIGTLKNKIYKKERRC